MQSIGGPSGESAVTGATRRRVCIIDDDESIRRALKRLLSTMGHDALTFESAEDFLGSAFLHGEGCLILDIRLPGMTGLDLYEKLVSWGTKYRVIFITAHDNTRWRERAKKAGAVAYLEKPFQEYALREVIDLACGNGLDAH